MKVKLLSFVRLFVTPWIVAHQAPPSMEFSRQEDWSGLPFPFPGFVHFKTGWFVLSTYKDFGKKEKKKSKMVEEALQITEKKRSKRQREKERYIHLNAEFQRTARGYKSSYVINANK